MAELRLGEDVLQFVRPLLERVDFSAPDLAASSCGCGCGCSGGGGGGGGGGSGKVANDLIIAGNPKG